jgi:murein DD-endopeptidase MepM/ murein hydrolase activator NlpD
VVTRIGLIEAMGLRPFGTRLREALFALRGDGDVPPSRFDLSSLTQLRPRIATKLWRGKPFVPRRVIITNLYNHRQTPIEAGWSVRKTQVEDFRGRDLTYDSHNGTDFSIAVGTTVVAAAPGEVVRIATEFNRGGLKIFIDHGRGLMTCTAHLGRALVRVGERLERGQPYAISGYSGLDSLVTFPWGTPHIHYNVWLNGEPIDPFPHQGEPSLWRGGDLPAPATELPLADEAWEPSAYDAEAVDEAISTCSAAAVRQRLRAVQLAKYRAAELIAEMNYYPTRFGGPCRLVYAERHPRRPVLDLPFTAADFDGVLFVDDLS